jgi:pilus assembly protein CpaF
MEADVITMQDLFRFKIADVASDGKVVGNLSCTGLRPALLHKFEKRGVELPLTMFQSGLGSVQGNGAAERPTL